jgi:hypothetical protein
MSVLVSSNRFRRSAIWVLAIAVTAIGVAWRALAQSEADSSATVVLALGGGTTIIQGGTGKSGGFVPVITTVAFHAEKKGATITGSFECLAKAPEHATGAGSAQFTVNVMYVTGQITTATISRDTATLTGTADITGLGVGTGVPFTFVVSGGGPGSAAVLTTEGSPRLVFNETLLEGAFKILPEHFHDR